MTLANYLYSLVYSDTYDKEQWQNWAYRLIKDVDYNDDTEWIFDVYMAETKKDLFKAISERKNWVEFYTDKYWINDIIQGYYFYQYKRGLISLYDLLRKSSDIADEDDEHFYQLLKDIVFNPDIVNSSEYLKRVFNYFNPLYCAAMVQKEKLESATPECLDVEE